MVCSAFVGESVSEVSGNCRDSFVGVAAVTIVVATLGWCVDTKENVFMLANDAGFGSDPNTTEPDTVRDAEATDTVESPT